MKDKRFLLLPGLFLASSVFLSCGDSASTGPQGEDPRPTNITITPPTASLDAVGATVQFTATVRDQMNRPIAGVSVSWSSSV